MSGSCRLLCLMFLLLVAVSCVHVPQESVQLSEELTSMINSAQESHLRLIDAYVAERRSRADDFMESRWIPTFVGDFVTRSNVLEDINKASSPFEKGKIMLEFAEAASAQIFQRRAAIMNAVNKIDMSLKEAIRAHYADMLTVNLALTSHLRSAAEVTTTREELLRQLRIEPRGILPIDGINDCIEKIVNYEGETGNISGIIEEVDDLIRGER